MKNLKWAFICDYILVSFNVENKYQRQLKMAYKLFYLHNYTENFILFPLLNVCTVCKLYFSKILYYLFRF